MCRLLLLGAIFLGLAGTAHAVVLVDDAGNPIGGQFQTYADRAQVPTLAGALIVRDATGECPVACSQGPYKVVNADGSLWVHTAAFGPTVTWVNPGAAGEYQFDWELGHQFDWAYLTDDDRQAFAAMWLAPNAEWWNSDNTQNHGGEDGLERIFAADYASCAMGYPPSGAAEPTDRQQVCELIDTIGQRAGAHMPPPKPPIVTPVTVTSRKAPAQAPHRSRRRRHSSPFRRAGSWRRQGICTGYLASSRTRECRS